MPCVRFRLLGTPSGFVTGHAAMTHGRTDLFGAYSPMTETTELALANCRTAKCADRQCLFTWLSCLRTLLATFDW